MLASYDGRGVSMTRSLQATRSKGIFQAATELGTIGSGQRLRIKVAEIINEVVLRESAAKPHGVTTHPSAAL